MPARRSTRSSLVAIVALLCATTVAATPDASPRVELDHPESKSTSAAADPSFGFVRNDGQVDASIRFHQRTHFGAAAVVSDGITYTAADSGTLLTERLIGAMAWRPHGLARQPTIVNYYLGEERSSWTTGVPTFESVGIGEVYPGITLHLGERDGSVEKVFTVSGSADPSTIEIEVDDASISHVGADGRLFVRPTARGGLVAFSAPVAYQSAGADRRNVEIAYQLRGGNRYGFVVGRYDAALALIIDPVLEVRYIGSTDFEDPQSLVAAGDGTVYVGGVTTGVLPEISGTPPAGTNGFIYAMDEDLSDVLYADYFGMAAFDSLNTLVIGPSGDLYAMGGTTSADYPEVASPDMGGIDIWIGRLSSQLAFQESHRLGGDGQDSATGLAILPSGTIYIGGFTNSTDFYGKTGLGGFDLFVARIDDLSAPNPTVTAEREGTSLADTGGFLVVDANNNVFMAGNTESMTFPGMGGSGHTPPNGLLLKYDDALNAMSRMYLAGNDEDIVQTLTARANGNILAIGNTRSTDFPVVGPTGGRDIFIVEVDSALSTVLVSDKFGGSNNDLGSRVVEVPSGVMLSGSTRSPDFPLGGVGDDLSHNGAQDGFILIRDTPSGPTTYGTFLGGTGREESPAIDTPSGIYAFGTTRSDFGLDDLGSATVHGALPSPASESVADDAFVVRLSVPDNDGDGLNDLFEALFGGNGINVTNPETGDQAVGTADGADRTIISGSLTVIFPASAVVDAGSGATSIDITYAPGPFPAVSIVGADLGGGTKSVALPIGLGTAICIADTATAGISAVTTGTCGAVPVGCPPATPGNIEIAIPATTVSVVSQTPAPECVPTTYTLETTGINVRIDGLVHSALAVVNNPPECDRATATPSTLWPPNHQLVPVGISGVTDADADGLVITINAIFQDEPVDTGDDPEFAPDGFGIGTETAVLRAERDGAGDGRVYHITFSAADQRGGTCAGEALVSVPKSQNQSAVDGGPLYDSTA